MQTQIIRKMIKEATTTEKNTRNLADALSGFARMRGIQLSPQHVNEGVEFIRQYIEHVPILLDQINSAAKKTGISNQITPILEAAEQYFLNPLDIIPDHLGLLGLVDDAYLTQSLIQALSDKYRAQTGGTLLPVELTTVNQFIRSLIGEPQASMLDAAVQGALGGSVIEHSLKALLGAVDTFDMAGPDPIWGNATPEEIANVQLGAWGVV